MVDETKKTSTTASDVDSASSSPGASGRWSWASKFHTPEFLKQLIPEFVLRAFGWLRGKAVSWHLFRNVDIEQSAADVLASSTISVIVPIHDAPAVTRRCLASLEKFARASEIILIDDASRLAETKEIIETFSSRNGWKVIRHDRPRGHSEACRAGANVASRPFLCLLNSDTVVTPWCWRRIKEEFERDPRVGAAGPSTSASPNLQQLPLACTYLVYWDDYEICAFAKRLLDERQDPGVTDLPWVCGFAFFIRRDLWEQLGGFDQNLPDYGNEIELCERIKAKGYRTVWVRDSYIHHTGAQSYKGKFGENGIEVRSRIAASYVRQKQLDLQAPKPISSPDGRLVRVTALIPTYNRRTQVLRAIDSVLAQTVPVDEIIVVDDGSTDETADAIRDRYGSRVTVLWQQNAGVSAARNHGIREARGEWIALLDSDDIWFPMKIERQLDLVATIGDEFGLCFTDCAIDRAPNIERTVFQENGLENASSSGALDEPARFVMVGQYPFWTQSLLVRRSLFQQVGGFDEDLTIQEDRDVIFRMGFKTRFCYVAERLVVIDRNPNRTDGLCDLYEKRVDRKYDDLQRLYTHWLAMPEVKGSKYERSIVEMLRTVCYDSLECKIHEIKIRPALREVDRLRDLGDSYPTIVDRLLTHKLAKLRRRMRATKSGEAEKQVGPALGGA